MSSNHNKTLLQLKESEIGRTTITMFEEAINPKYGTPTKSVKQTWSPQHLTLSDAIERVMHGGDINDPNPSTRHIVGEIRKLTKFIQNTDNAKATKPKFETVLEEDAWYIDQLLSNTTPLSTQLHNAKVKKKNLKESLPCLVYGGKFETRITSDLIEHSGFMCVDFDGIDLTDCDGDPTRSKDYKNLITSPYVVFVFVSPSGNGLKGLVRIPKCTAEEHSLYFKIFPMVNKFTNAWDDQTSDATRICYESYDPNPYINPNAKMFAPNLDKVRAKLESIKIAERKAKAKEQGKEFKPFVPSTNDTILFPLTDDNKIIEIVKNFNNPHQWVKGQMHSYTVHVANQFCAHGVSEQSTVDYLIREVASPTDNKNKIRQDVAACYQAKYLPKRSLEDFTKRIEVSKAIRKGKAAVIASGLYDKSTIEILDAANKEYKKKKMEERESKRSLKERYRRNRNEVIDSGEADPETLAELSKEISEEFWYYTKPKKVDEEGKVMIDPDKFINFLESKGFCKYYPHGIDNDTQLLKNNNGIIYETSIKHIRDYVIKYLKDGGHFNVLPAIRTNRTVFMDSFISGIQTINVEQVRSKRYAEYIPFLNGQLEITPNGTKLLEYSQLDGYTWKNTILNKSKFNPIVDNTNDFKTILYNVSGGQPLPFECAFGYMISRFNDLGKSKVIILNDENNTTDKEGGTFKGGFGQAVKEIRDTFFIDGKLHKNDNGFALGKVRASTNIVHWDDMKESFPFENLFSMVTDGLTTTKKGEDSVRIDAEFAPKHLLVVNHQMSGSGHSHDRRRHKLVFKQYYGSTRNLRDEFGHQVFRDWDEEHFNRFYNYAVECIQKYMKHGHVKQTNIENQELTKLIANTKAEFVDFMDDYDINVGDTISKSEIHEHFKRTNPDFFKLRQRTFTDWIAKYAKYKKLVIEHGRTSNINTWFKFIDPNQSKENKNRGVYDLKASIERDKKLKVKESETSPIEKEDMFEAFFRSVR